MAMQDRWDEQAQQIKLHPLFADIADRVFSDVTNTHSFRDNVATSVIGCDAHLQQCSKQADPIVMPSTQPAVLLPPFWDAGTSPRRSSNSTPLVLLEEDVATITSHQPSRPASRPPSQQPQQISHCGNTGAPVQLCSPTAFCASSRRHAGGASSPDMNGIAVLEFKLERRIRCAIPPDVHVVPGQYAIIRLLNNVEDAALCLTTHAPGDRHGLPRGLGHHDEGVVLRAATAADCEIINHGMPELEVKALQQCHELVHFLHLPFTCVDSEASFDLKQVKVYYSLAPEAFTTNAPSVSRLQRELTCALKCKALLEQVVPLAR